MFQSRSILACVTFSFCLLLTCTPSVMAADLKVSGNINLDGKLIAEGKVTFHFENGQFMGSKVKDGKYTVDRLPPGKYKVTVEGKTCR